jgi:hypothetical protein
MPSNIPVVWKSFIEVRNQTLICDCFCLIGSFYKNCWQRDPEERPDFREITNWLRELPTKSPQLAGVDGK